MLNGGAGVVRKELEERFRRTRLILREEGKMQKHHKLQRIYELKQKKGKGYLTKGEREKEAPSQCSPWQKTRLDSCFEDEEFPTRSIEHKAEV
jgi:hypothetical protein